MAGPWEKYQRKEQAAEGPWSKYQTGASAPAVMDKPESNNGLGAQLMQRGRNIGDAITGKPIYGSDEAGVPARAVRTAGQVSGGIGDVIGAGFNKAIDLIPDRAKSAVSSAAGNVINAVGGITLPLYRGNDTVRTPTKLSEVWSDIKTDLIPKIAASYEDAPPGELEFLGDLIGTADLIGAAGAAKGLAKAGGELIETGGKSAMRSALKIKDVTARKAGRTVDEGVENIVNNIAKHKVQSTTGGVRGIANNARKQIDNLTDRSDALLRGFAQQNPNARVDVESIMLQYMDDLANAKVPGLRVEGENAANLVDKTYKALEKSGLGGLQPVEKIPEIKKFIRDEFKIFGKGPMNIGDDAFKAQVADHAYLRMKSALDEAIPEMRQIGTDMRELIEIEDAMAEAAKRIGNKDKIGLADLGVLLSGQAISQTAPLPGWMKATGFVPGAILIGKKATGYGRGGSGLISAGQISQGASRLPILPSRKATPLIMLPNRDGQNERKETR